MNGAFYIAQSVMGTNSEDKTHQIEEVGKLLDDVFSQNDLKDSMAGTLFNKSDLKRFVVEFGKATGKGYLEPLDGSWLVVETPVHDKRTILRDKLGLNDPERLKKDKEEERGVMLQESFVPGYNFPVKPRPLSKHVEPSSSRR